MLPIYNVALQPNHCYFKTRQRGVVLLKQLLNILFLNLSYVKYINK